MSTVTFKRSFLGVQDDRFGTGGDLRGRVGTDQRTNEIDREGEQRRRVVLRRDLGHRLQVTELKGDRLLGQDGGRGRQRAGRLELTLRRWNLTNYSYDTILQSHQLITNDSGRASMDIAASQSCRPR